MQSGVPNGYLKFDRRSEDLDKRLERVSLAIGPPHMLIRQLPIETIGQNIASPYVGGFGRIGLGSSRSSSRRSIALAPVLTSTKERNHAHCALSYLAKRWTGQSKLAASSIDTIASSKVDDYTVQRVVSPNRPVSYRYHFKGRFVACAHVPSNVLSRLHTTLGSDTPLLPDDSRRLAREAAFSHSIEPVIQHFNTSRSSSPVAMSDAVNGAGSSGSPVSTPGAVMFTPEQLQAFANIVLSTHSQSANNSTPAPASTPAPPPFTSTAQPLSSSKSFYSLFPHVEEKLVLDITRHEFRPWSLHKLDPRIRSKADAVDGGLDVLSKGSGSTKDYPSLDSLTVPLGHYFDILITYARFSGSADAGCALASGAVRYISTLSELAKKYQWLSVLQYHVDYMNVRRYEMKEGNYLGWGPIDGPLYALVAANPKPIAPAFLASKSKAPKDSAQQPCFKWNKGECSDPCPDDRLHICRDCLAKDHKRNDPACKKGKSASR
ncbi:hypothetical protein D9757_000001 [Collybiopsis confluens]|uniref:Uncharacterized protein n=1 Tax=Collybiopsis confluens TaxID=2823264 RepID=A0A8H5MGW5_9AGAR|nr:hypothetical protein D9757_000001 [Collybiopsis confluens]